MNWLLLGQAASLSVVVMSLAVFLVTLKLGDIMCAQMHTKTDNVTLSIGGTPYILGIASGLFYYLVRI